MAEIKIIDPLKITSDDLPMVVFSDDLRGFLGWAIKHHTSGNYNHTMWMTDIGYFVSQAWLYKEIPIKVYMKPRYRLKFWSIIGLSNEDKANLYRHIANKLNQPWWKNTYDWFGAGIGQLLKVKWLNIPWLEYCSEDVGNGLRTIPSIKDYIPKHPSPSDLNKLFETIPKMKYYGHWMVD